MLCTAAGRILSIFSTCMVTAHTCIYCVLPGIFFYQYAVVIYKPSHCYTCEEDNVSYHTSHTHTHTHTHTPAN